MANTIDVIRISSDAFDDIQTYLDKNPKYLFFSSSYGTILKVDLKQEKEKSDSEENIVARWMNGIKKLVKEPGVTSEASLKKIDAYCDAVIVAVTSK